MQRYSFFSLVRNAIGHHEGWQEAWRSPPPKPSYSVVIVGGGGHGLATAYYLAKEHGITNVAVLEKGWLGGGNTARNTTHVRSDYILDDNAHFYEASLKLWEGLSTELNYNVMFSQRGMIRTANFDAQTQALLRRGNGMRVNGIDAVFLSREEVRRLAPALDFSATARFPITGAFFQPRAGNARHDAIAWGFARGADSRGVDIIQNCEVTGFRIKLGAVTGVGSAGNECRFQRACGAARISGSGRIGGLYRALSARRRFSVRGRPTQASTAGSARGRIRPAIPEEAAPAARRSMRRDRQ